MSGHENLISEQQDYNTSQVGKSIGLPAKSLVDHMNSTNIMKNDFEYRKRA